MTFSAMVMLIAHPLRLGRFTANDSILLNVTKKIPLHTHLD